MNVFDEALVEVIEVMLEQNNCRAENAIVRDKFAILLRKRLRTIALTTSNLACHAGRAAPCYFDLERAFRRLDISANALREFHYAKSEKYPPVVNFCAYETRDVDLHQKPQRDINQQRGQRGGRHIPKHIPPFPGLHTYKNTKMNVVTDRGYVSERERSAVLSQSTQRALNKFYLRTQPRVSLFNEPQSDTDFMVLISNKSKKPAYMTALMPRNEVYDVDIYEFNDQPTGLALTNPFLKKPKEYYVIKHPDVEINEDPSKHKDGGNESDQQNDNEQDEDMEEKNKQGSSNESADETMANSVKDVEKDLASDSDSDMDNDKDNENGDDNVKTCHDYWQMPNLNKDTF